MEKIDELSRCSDRIDEHSQQIVNLGLTLARVEERFSQIQNENSRLEGKLDKIFSVIEAMGSRYVLRDDLRAFEQRLKEDLGAGSKRFEDIERQILEIKLKPAQKWDGLVKTVLGLVAGGIFTYIITQMGVK